MGTAEIATRGNEILELVEQLRRCRAIRWSSPDDDRHGVPLPLIDKAILSLVTLGYLAGELNAADVARFSEAWLDL